MKDTFTYTLNIIPKAQMVEEESWLLQVVFLPLHIHNDISIHLSHTWSINKSKMLNVFPFWYIDLLCNPKEMGEVTVADRHRTWTNDNNNK